MITKLLSICIIFTNYTERFVKQLTAQEEGGVGGRESRKRVAEQGSKLLSNEGFAATLLKFETNFNHYFRLLLEALPGFSSAQLDRETDLVLRLDFNDFYATQWNL